MHSFDIFIEKPFNRENAVTKQLKMGEIKVEEDKGEIWQNSQREMVWIQKP